MCRRGGQGWAALVRSMGAADVPEDFMVVPGRCCGSADAGREIGVQGHKPVAAWQVRAGTLNRPTAKAMHKEFSWSLTAGVLLALVLHIPRHLSVAATLKGNPLPGAMASARASGPIAGSLPNPLLPLSRLLGVMERSD